MIRIRTVQEHIRELIFCIIVLATACQPTSVEKNRGTASNIILVDATGLEVTLEEPARRIISLVPSATETLRALGAIHTVVGRTDFDLAVSYTHLTLPTNREV